ncbi:MAG: LysR family transcriptional regulator [Bacteroidota bacterium]|jgi:DNA-binding transcriptional LysR family regulator|nr:LysR family transcriptional regulator [Bacteroidota bacterium]
MNYTLHQLMVFSIIAKTQSITKAAEELNLTQPAVSIQLKNFQDQFELPLTELIGRKLFITDFGKEIAAAANTILEEVNAINYKTQAYKGLLSGKLKIAVVSTGIYVMPFFLEGFMQVHPEIELSLDVTNKAKVLESLENNVIDFAMVSVLPEDMAIENIQLLQNKLYLISNTTQKFQSKKYPLSILEKMPLIFREQGSGTRLSMESFFEKKQLHIKQKLELTSNEAVKQAVLAGLGSAIMPLIGIKNELLNGSLQVIPLVHFPIITNWQLIWLKGKKHSAIGKALLQYIDQEKEKIVKKYFNWYEQF